MLRNADIAEMLERLAALYELDGAEPYRVNAYRQAAESVRHATVSVAELARSGRATELPRVGPTIAGKIRDFVESGTVPALERLLAKYPPGLLEVMEVPGIGAKRARLLWETLGVGSLEDLERAVETGRIAEVAGFGGRTVERLRRALERLRQRPLAERSRLLLISDACGAAERVLALLAECDGVVAAEAVGGVRRAVEATADVDLLAAAAVSAREVGERLAGSGAFQSVALSEDGDGGREAAGVARLALQTHDGIAVDLRLCAPDAFAVSLQQLTGSQRHSARIRELASEQGIELSPAGARRAGAALRCATEADVYALVGMPWIPPELREDRGEIEAAQAGSLPDLVTVEQIRGDLHCHTTASDGRADARTMALAARERGYEYLAITDHSASHGFGNAVSASELEQQIERVAALDAELEGITLLCGSEISLRPDGSLDYPDELVERLDWVIASVHTSFALPEREMTARIVAAMENPLVDAIGHPTGRLIGRRDPYAVDVEALIEAAVKTGTMLEINANPDRRDLSEVWARLAAEAGAMLVINSDAHSPEGFDLIRYGVATARRGWVGARSVANTRPLAELRRLRKRARV
ncbi:MAG: DNA polymerase/3'-5' exonuclease PolX [Thermoleophilum sp.]|nr:DNA polymerase/3'-5' exonuclease PolX [Thermoleophilum sp.]